MYRILFVCFSLISLISLSQDLYKIDTIYPVHDLMNNLKVIEDMNDSFTHQRILNDLRLYDMIYISLSAAAPMLVTDSEL